MFSYGADITEKYYVKSNFLNLFSHNTYPILSPGLRGVKDGGAVAACCADRMAHEQA